MRERKDPFLLPKCPDTKRMFAISDFVVIFIKAQKPSPPHPFKSSSLFVNHRLSKMSVAAIRVADVANFAQNIFVSNYIKGKIINGFTHLHLLRHPYMRIFSQ